MTKYPTEQLKCWNKAKEIRENFYKNYATAKDKGGIRWAGGAWSFGAIPAGLGDDVYMITGEPYGASVAWNKDFAVECQEAAEKAGFARDLCAYMRNYWGSMILDKYAFGGKFPKPDFIWQDHICCSHAKWYQVVSEYEKVPMFCTDVSTGPYSELNESRLKYVVDQLHEGILWLEKVSGRKYNDQKLIDAVYSECEATATWAEVCVLNKTIPAPLDEKTMYSLYVLGTLMKHSPIVRDFYKELRDEVKDRVKRGIAAVPNERCRVMSDTQPPWAFLKVFRYLEKFGCVSIGSLYTFGLIGMWEDKPDLPAPRPGKFFVYAIKCDDDSIYIGQTDDLPRRWQEHLEGTAADWTSSHKPVSIVHYEEYSTREKAVKREQDLKTGFGRKWLIREIEAGRARQAGGTWGPKTTPQQKGIKIKTRDEALRVIADWTLSRPEYQHFYDPALKSAMMVRIAKEWKLNGVMLHYNRGCEGLSLGIAENRLAIQKAGFPVMTFEGNMGDEREFDEGRTMTRIDTFMETLGLNKLED